MKTGKKSHLFIWKESGCDLNKGNNTQKGSSVKHTPSELAVLTTHLKGILKEQTERLYALETQDFLTTELRGT